MSNTLPLVEVKRHDSLGLLREAMQRVGPASQTLGAVRAMAAGSGETFASVPVIAERACLPIRTVERHLERLVQNNWLQRRGREKRRTPTYIVPNDLLNRSDALKFAILPRWAARLLTTWAERAVFASIVSRDSLLEVIGDGSGLDVHQRGDYSLHVLAQETGLSRQSICNAKLRLVQRDLIIIERAMCWRDHLGRCRTYADTLFLNPDFQVPEQLIDRRPKMADCAAPGTLLDSSYRSLKLADTQSKNGGPVGPKMADTRSRNGGCSDTQVLDQLPNASVNATAESSHATNSAGSFAVEVTEEVLEEQQNHGDHDRSINMETRVQSLTEQLQRLLQADSA
jgi:DNA-binding MarR family transcriptional regulator